MTLTLLLFPSLPSLLRVGGTLSLAKKCPPTVTPTPHCHLAAFSSEPDSILAAAAFTCLASGAPGFASEREGPASHQPLPPGLSLSPVWWLHYQHHARCHGYGDAQFPGLLPTFLAMPHLSCTPPASPCPLPPVTCHRGPFSSFSSCRHYNGIPALPGPRGNPKQGRT